MAVRTFVVGAVLGGALLISLSLTPWSAVQAGYKGASTPAGQLKRPQFRPWQRSAAVSGQARWRPPAGVGEHLSASPLAGPARSVTATPGTSVARLSVEPLSATRVEPLLPRRNQRFRPERQAADAPLAVAGAHSDAYRHAARQHSQFRPTRKPQRQSYEELQAQQAATRAPRPLTSSYRAQAGSLLPGFEGYWPVW